MINFSSIKLIIWDLDETLWKGTLSNNDVLLLNLNFVNFINNSLDRGIVHSICSKNDFELTKKHLSSLELWDLFVFPSINWTPKGKRIEQIITDMGLRAPNVLFVDDNISNLNEARFYCKDIQICTPTELEESIDSLNNLKKIDPSRPRLSQYRILEKKSQSKKDFSSNEEFLMSCNIRVEFNEKCLEQLDRIHDLIMRSNQLNYTKYRQDKEDLLNDLMLPTTKAAYVTVSDDFGDYGIVGFYMITNDQVKHFLFSCRTLGMLIELYVYRQIGCPPISVIGDVVTQLDDTIATPWINAQASTLKNEKNKKVILNQNILLKGPCDISQIFSFIEETPCICSEFTYTNDAGISVEGHNHTSQMVTAFCATDEEKTKMINSTPWLDSKMLNVSFWAQADSIVFSLLTDGNLGIYEHCETGKQIALCEKFYDLTNEKNWEDYILKRIFTSNIEFTKEKLKIFASQYKYVSNENGDVTIQNLDFLYKKIKKHTKLILLLGSEKPFLGTTKLSYENREQFHKTLNEKVRKWAIDKPNVHLIEIGKYIHNQKDYTDTINHFQKKVYYDMAQDIIALLDTNKTTLKMKSRQYLFLISSKKSIRDFIKKIIKRN